MTPYMKDLVDEVKKNYARYGQPEAFSDDRPEINIGDAFNKREPYYGNHLKKKFVEELCQKVDTYIINILNNLSPRGSELLDVGVGSGERIIKYLSLPYVKSVQGLDISEEMIKAAKSRGIDTKKGSFGEIEGKFDIITSLFEVINYVDLDYIFGNVSKSLRKGGIFSADSLEIQNDDSKGKRFYVYATPKSNDKKDGLILRDNFLPMSEKNPPVITYMELHKEKDILFSAKKHGLEILKDGPLVINHGCGYISKVYAFQNK
jgi:SAM-dependent methyltransferase